MKRCELWNGKLSWSSWPIGTAVVHWYLHLSANSTKKKAITKFIKDNKYSTKRNIHIERYETTKISKTKEQLAYVGVLVSFQQQQQQQQ
jgi:hypothetical protein